MKKIGIYAGIVLLFLVLAYGFVRYNRLQEYVAGGGGVEQGSS